MHVSEFEQNDVQKQKYLKAGSFWCASNDRAGLYTLFTHVSWKVMFLLELFTSCIKNDPTKLVLDLSSLWNNWNSKELDHLWCESHELTLCLLYWQIFIVIEFSMGILAAAIKMIPQNTYWTSSTLPLIKIPGRGIIFDVFAMTGLGDSLLIFLNSHKASMCILTIYSKHDSLKHRLGCVNSSWQWHKLWDGWFSIY